MKITATTFVTATALFGFSSAASDRWNNEQDLKDLSYSLIAPFSEKYCKDLTEEICRNKGGHWMRYSVFDPATGSCVCSTKPSISVVSKQCPDITCPSVLERVFYWPSTGECFCEAEDFFSRAWNTADGKERSPEPPVFPAEHFGPVKEKFDVFTSYLVAAKAALINSDMDVGVYELRALNEKARNKRQSPAETSSSPSSSDTAVPTFIPPPKTDIDPQLLNQSLQVQPQNTATISSVVMQILDEKVMFSFQMNGIIADSFTINASTSMACGALGTEPEPDIQVVPRSVQPGQGAPQTLIADCRCIAVNMNDPKVINYYVQDNQGKIYSLTGSNKIVGINQLDTSQPLAVSLVTIASGNQKRDVSAKSNVLPLKARQVLNVPCGQPCPFAFMRYIQSENGDCGCVFKGNDNASISKRGISAPDMYSATMSQEACDAMTCQDNGGKPAMFNPFTKTCWCVVPPYFEDNPSAWTPST